MNQFDRSLSSVGIGALLAAALAALFSLLSMVTGASFFSVLAIIFAVLGVVFVILILLKIKARSGSAASSLSASASVSEDNVRSAIRQLERMTEGNFSEEAMSGDPDPLLSAVARLRDTLGQIMGGVSEEMAAISDSGEQLSSASERLTQVFFRQDEMLRGIYSPVMAVSSAAAKNAETAREANQYAAAAAADVQNGADQMQELLGAMDEINRSTDEIAKFIKTIEEIAFQTNILALNSSVEAAHAGEAGKGFAVVATEVKTLANRSQETAKNTNRLIQSCVASARIGVEKTSAAVKALAAASEETRSVRGLIDVISRECDAQSDSIGKINQDFAQIEGIMNNANAAASECSERIRTLSGHSDRLKSDLKDFKGMARSHTNRAGKPVGSGNVDTPAPQSPASKPAARTASAAKPSAPAPKPAEKATSAVKPSAPAPKPAARTTSAGNTAKPSAPAPKPAEKTASTVKPSAPASKPVAKAPSAVSTSKPSAPAPKPADKAASAVKPSAVSAPKPAAKTASAVKPSAPAPKPAAKTPSTVSTAKPATVPKSAVAGTILQSTPAFKAAPASASSVSAAPKKSEPMPTSLPEKFETVKFVDIPDSKY